MNEIMLLFTIATIVYLPPTFVAVGIFLLYDQEFISMELKLWLTLY